MTAAIEYRHGIFCWIDLNSHDMAAAAAWYGELFGWRVEIGQTPAGPPYGTFYLHERPIAGIGEMSKEMKAQGIPPLWNTYIFVDDAAAIERRVVELGGKVVFPCTKMGEFGTLAFFSDPGRASFAVWQAGTLAGVQLIGPNTWCWSELASRDVAASCRFYGELFGWKYKTDGGTPEYTEIMVGERVIGGMIAIQPEWGPMPPSWGVYIEVADIDATAAAVSRTGGRVVSGPRTVDGVGRFCAVTDPQGGRFSLIQLQQRIR